MAALGITLDMIIELKNKEYLETLKPKDTDTEEQKEKKEKRKKEFIQGLKDAIKDVIEQQIAKAEALLASVVMTVQQIVKAVPTWTAQIAALAVPDPMAPKAGAGALLSIKNSVAMAKSNIAVASAQMEELTGLINTFGVESPAIIATTKESLSSADSLLNTVPI